MLGKVVISFILALLIFIPCSVLIGTLDIRSYCQQSPPIIATARCADEAPLRVPAIIATAPSADEAPFRVPAIIATAPCADEAPLRVPAIIATVPCADEAPLRVYMYDLHRRFNVGMLDRRNTTEAPVTGVDYPLWLDNSGLMRQHSVEYWMMGSLLNGGGNGSEAVRVLDPEVADVFFVPFFSSLSFNTHGHLMTDPETKIDRQLQVFDWFDPT